MTKDQNWKRIQVEILERLKAGESKEELYRSYWKDSDDKNLRLFLAAQPSTELKEKYTIQNRILVGLWIFIFIFETFGTVMEVMENSNTLLFFSLIIPLLILIGLVRFKGTVYLPAIIWLIWNLIVSLFELRNYTEEDWNDPYIIGFVAIYLLAVVISILLSNIIRNNAFNHYDWFYPYKDVQGNYLYE